MHRRSKINNLRRTIRALQEIPVVLSVFVLVNFISDTLRLDIGKYLCVFFGFSEYLLVRLYLISRRMYVSRWSRVLYVTLILVCTIVILDEIFAFSLVFVELQELVFCMFITGVLSSLCTYVHGKWQKSRKKQ